MAVGTDKLVISSLAHFVSASLILWSAAAQEMEEEEFYDSLFCPACNKAFKSEKA